MRKQLLGICILTLVLLLAACSAKNEGEEGTTLTEQANDVADSVKDSFKSMGEAIASGEQVHCTATTLINDEKATTEIWSSGKNQRIEMMSTQGNMMAIYTSEWIYSWNPETKTGMKMNMEMVKELAKNAEGTNQGSVPSPISTPDLDELSASSVDFSCTPTLISSEKFTPPSDVVFQDLTDMMKLASEMQKNMGAGQAPTEEDLAKMQEEYAKMQESK